MNTMMIKIISVEEPQFNKTARGGYNSIEVVYTNKSFQDKVEKRKIMDFTNKEVYKIIASAKKDDVFTVSREKDEKGFWQWVAISTDVKTPLEKQEAPSKATPAPKSTYETPEERAKRQVYIVKQSSIANAIEYLNHSKKTYHVGDILETAQIFVDFVFGIPLDTDNTELPPNDEDDDIPF